MNTRTRQIIRAILMRENPRIPATINDGKYCWMVFIEQDQLTVYQDKYGDALTVWWEIEDSQNDNCKKR